MKTFWGIAVLLASYPAIGAAPNAAAAADIRDIRGPIPIWSPWHSIIAVLVAFAVLVAVFVLVKKWRQHPARPLTAEERALAALDVARPLAESGQSREYAGAMTEALRAYIEERFDLHAAHATSDEFLGEVMARGKISRADQRDSLSHFLAACDLAKFARFRLADAEMSALHGAAREFILASAPEPNESARRPS